MRLTCNQAFDESTFPRIFYLRSISRGVSTRQSCPSYQPLARKNSILTPTSSALVRVLLVRVLLVGPYDGSNTSKHWRRYVNLCVHWLVCQVAAGVAISLPCEHCHRTMHHGRNVVYAYKRMAAFDQQLFEKLLAVLTLCNLRAARSITSSA